ncbi:hypothetical protein D6T64_08595 [Cryobacterium melibiosiphilum]|uniref:Histidine kinase domain-containing protein n=1 Tax=Cryobacterium melibiosiphilum TaxID=995039 RepID=A0A3A5MFR3_9MICO|nr:ATP-binding protein [Cryobacterium melibiosiphilum]RJT89010.1 hypothetical protein D6T64_08595 [Cryobacterium melibiosiphilum]
MLQDPNVPPSASATPADAGRSAAGSSEPAAGTSPAPVPTASGPAASGPTAAAPVSALPPRSRLRAAVRRLLGRPENTPGAHRVTAPDTAKADTPLTALLTALLAEREIALGGIREGVIAVDSRGQVTRFNETARLLLELPTTAVGTPLTQLGLDAGAVRALSARRADDRDLACVAAGRMLVLNQVTVQPRRGRSETVTTLRDRTELVTLRLPGARAPGPVGLPSPSNQTDEFTHRVHTVETIAALAEASVGAASDRPEPLSYLTAICAEQRGPLTRIMDPFVAALLISRTAVVSGRGAALRLTVDSALPRLDPATSADVVTVLGILLDNALDSVDGSTVRQITVQIDCTTAGAEAPLAARLVDVRVRVHDTGPGIAGGLIDHIFEVEQVTQAPVRHRADPGFGLAIVQLVATRRGGSVGYDFADGAAFDAVLPVRPAPEA